ncbi:MAG: 3-dehydroquinate synthase [Lachnospiraceae bacterium]|nr:3-dehydroquinate synthase [Lachnospiraceae bacterium]
MKEFSVSASTVNKYDIVITEDYSEFGDRFKGLFPESARVLIVTDENVCKAGYPDVIKEQLKDRYDTDVLILPPGEPTKSFEYLNKILSTLIGKKFNRNDVLIGLGGGVIGDLTGFAASIFKRGIPFVQVPTTLLSMVDSSIGGKTAIDYEGVKNSIGAFYMPSLVYAAIDSLKTLPEREYYAGFAEIMKAGLLAKESFYVWLVDHIYEISDKEPETLINMIETAQGIKRDIVAKDPFEHGDRVLLNLGHTIGHAIESYFKGEYLHGECVALGCVAAAFISWKMDMIPMELYYEIRDMFVPFNLPISFVTEDVTPMIDLLCNDKKNTGKAINMVLLKKAGKAVYVKDIDRELIKAALDELNFKEED